ncbi:MAG: 30S ribosomal protein S8, partial [Nanoarchaeota archaeon]|nr:30S ribosomal protein S8 [Nanoarchaeota archaeon]
MSQDIVADTLNQMMNIRRAGKTELTVKKHSKLLLSVLAIAKLKGYVKEYKADPET